MNREQFHLALATFLAALVTAVQQDSVVSALVVLWFLAVVPGALFLRLVGLRRSGIEAWVVTVGTSFALDALVTETLVYAHAWTPELGIFVLVSLAAGALTFELARARRAAMSGQFG